MEIMGITGGCGFKALPNPGLKFIRCRVLVFEGGKSDELPHHWFA